MYKKIINRLTKGNERSIKAKKHILASLVYRAILMSLGFVTIRINLTYLSAEAYGVWAVISSFIMWFDFLDFGLGNGLRNKFAESKAKNDDLAIKKYVSTTYFIIFLISSGLFVIFFICNFFVNWTAVFSAPLKYEQEISRLILFVFISFSLRFIFRLISTILAADQRASFRSLFDVIQKTFSLILILILLKTTEESLLYYGIVYSLTPVIVLIFANIYFFSREYKPYSPSIKYIDLKQTSGLMNLGLKFFVIQLTLLVMFSTDNMIISHILSAKEVTAYSFAQKLFQIVWVLSTITLNPFWPAFTDAYVKKDFKWIKNIMNKLRKLWLLIVVAAIALIFVSPIAYNFFDKKNEVVVPLSLTLAMAFWNILATHGHIYMYFLNGTGKIKLQFICSIIGAIINIPLSIFFAKHLNLGLAGIIMATTVSYSYSVIIGPIQYGLIIKEKAYGIFNK